MQNKYKEIANKLQIEFSKSYITSKIILAEVNNDFIKFDLNDTAFYSAILNNINTIIKDHKLNWHVTNLSENKLYLILYIFESNSIIN